MGQGQKTNRIIIPQARQAMDNFKYEVAAEVGLNVNEGSYWGDIPSRQCGAVGGHMVRRMIQQYEQQLSGTAGQTYQATAQANYGGTTR